MSEGKESLFNSKVISYPESLFSDESSFYGDEQQKASFEDRVRLYNPQHFWDIHQWSLQCIAGESNGSRYLPTVTTEPGVRIGPCKDISKPVNTNKGGLDQDHDLSQSSTIRGDEMEYVDKRQRANSPRNFYEGDMMAKQLDESIEDFLTRLPPSKTTIKTGPWIWIVDPYSQSQRQSIDYAGFKQVGFDMLDQFLTHKRSVEQTNSGRSAATANRILQTERDQLEQSILNLAKSKNVVSGKWMLFPKPNLVDKIWAIVAKNTLDGKLGCSAKVATNDGGSKPERVICIYTDDFSDKDDVKRVLKEMERLDLVTNDVNSRPFYYKCDAYTYLDILSGNEYKLKASMYCSRDLFKEMANK